MADTHGMNHTHTHSEDKKSCKENHFKKFMLLSIFLQQK